MYLTRIRIHNVGGFRDVTWKIDSAGPGWHVVVGDNGSGKSSFLRAVALALIGRDQAFGLRQEWDEWLRRGTTVGRVELDLRRAGQNSNDPTRKFRSGIELRRTDAYSAVELTQTTGDHGDPAPDTQKSRLFSASFGPFRRFSGRDSSRRERRSHHPLDRHLPLFEEDEGITEPLEWLQQLRYQALERGEDDLLSTVLTFINQDGFLPNGVELAEVSSEGVSFVDPNGAIVPVESLSHGYKAVLSMVFELVRQLGAARPKTELFSRDGLVVTAPGIALIDEIDVHLHPTWQREIGIWLCRLFPKFQFLVTTHSPLVLQAVGTGSVMKLGRPGSEEAASMITGETLDRLVFGDASDAYGTGLFGLGVTRSDRSKELLKELALLNIRQLRHDLLKVEADRAEWLRTVLSSSADAGLNEGTT